LPDNLATAGLVPLKQLVKPPELSCWKKSRATWSGAQHLTAATVRVISAKNGMRLEDIMAMATELIAYILKGDNCAHRTSLPTRYTIFIIHCFYMFRPQEKAILCGRVTLLISVKSCPCTGLDKSLGFQ
jgi:hypothetical protein